MKGYSRTSNGNSIEIVSQVLKVLKLRHFTMAFLKLEKNFQYYDV
jgi:hypothetical protein